MIKILILEDEISLIRDYEKVVNYFNNYEFTFCKNKKEASSLTKKKTFNIAILDLHLGDDKYSGITIARQLMHSQTSVIGILSSEKKKDDVLRVSKEIAIDFYDKKEGLSYEYFHNSLIKSLSIYYNKKINDLTKNILIAPWWRSSINHIKESVSSMLNKKIIYIYGNDSALVEYLARAIMECLGIAYRHHLYSMKLESRSSSRIIYSFDRADEKYRNQVYQAVVENSVFVIATGRKDVFLNKEDNVKKICINDYFDSNQKKIKAIEYLCKLKDVNIDRSIIKGLAKEEWPGGVSELISVIGEIKKTKHIKMIDVLIYKKIHEFMEYVKDDSVNLLKLKKLPQLMKEIRVNLIKGVFSELGADYESISCFLKIDKKNISKLDGFSGATRTRLSKKEY